MKSFFKKKKNWFWIAGIIILLIILVFVFSGDGEVEYETDSVSMGDVVETVSVTGQIKPEESAILRFKISGIIDGLYVDVGDSVGKGGILARLDREELRRKLLQSQAELDSAEVDLENAKQDLTDTEIKNLQSLDSLYTDAPGTLNDILNLTLQTHATMGTFYDVNDDLLSTIKNSITNIQLVTNSNTAKLVADTAISQLIGVLGDFPAGAGEDDIREAVTEIQIPLQNFQGSLSSLITTINGVKTDLAISAATLESYKDSLNTAQSNLNSAISKYSTLDNDLDNISITNQLNLNSSESAYRLKASQVRTAEAAVAIAQTNLNQTYLRSPISGIVASRDKELGELVTTADQVFYIIGSEALEIVANIPEVDISRVKIGAEIDATLDALSADEHFVALVRSIDPDQTNIDGVVYYKIYADFDVLDERFKSGMSVNLDIVVEEKEDVLRVPRRAVKGRNGSSTVEVMVNGSIEEKEVHLGLKGDDFYEVVSGLANGEEVVIGTKKE